MSPRAALVLGAAIWPGGQPSPTLRRRARHAARLYHAGAVTHIIGCGGPGRHPPAEAEAIARICLEAGVPAAALLREDTSTRTLENIARARPLLARIGAREAVIVTDRYHAPRAWLTARALGLRARVSCPAPRGTSRRALARSWLREAAAILALPLTLWR